MSEELTAAGLVAQAKAKRVEAAALDADASSRRVEAVSLEERARRIEMAENAKVPVDRSQRVLVSGGPVTSEHLEIKPNGQQKDYVVLSDAERAKGFVRPVRDAYRHLKCGVVTTMSRALAETYARDPAFYSGTFCCGCGAHFPVGADGEFVWAGSDERVGA